MPKNTKTITFNIGLDYIDYIKDLVESGEYANASEVAREAFRDHKRERTKRKATEAVRNLVAGITDDDLIHDKTIEEIFAEALKNAKE